jgi:hypothetical protein
MQRHAGQTIMNGWVDPPPDEVMEEGDQGVYNLITEPVPHRGVNP